jgi:hypothetical protein
LHLGDRSLVIMLYCTLANQVWQAKLRIVWILLMISMWILLTNRG